MFLFILPWLHCRLSVPTSVMPGVHALCMRATFYMLFDILSITQSGFPVSSLNNCVLLCLHLSLNVWPSLWEMMNVQFDTRRLFPPPSAAGKHSFMPTFSKTFLTYRLTLLMAWTPVRISNSFWSLCCTEAESQETLCTKTWMASLKQYDFYFLAEGSSVPVAPGMRGTRWLGTDGGRSCLSVRRQTTEPLIHTPLRPSRSWFHIHIHQRTFSQ